MQKKCKYCGKEFNSTKMTADIAVTNAERRVSLK